MITVAQIDYGDPLQFEVRVEHGGGATEHLVSLSRADFDRMTSGDYKPSVVVEAAFHFLLDHEPKESILSRFDINVISRYFPEFESVLPRYIESTRKLDLS
ncbi:hypothetical protein GTW25_15950 [Aliihoeflea aestuarii]|nr:hypothetical protein [Aliihoeflea aestuarii]MCO6392518.1 hypothetical protein [Aliihoeflea aestuarii]